MNWTLLDHSVWQTLTIIIAFVIAYIVWNKQKKASRVVELYASQLLVDNRNSQGNTISRIPYIAIQNVGNNFVYLDKYVLNGREYEASSQVLPSTTTTTLENYYKIELPTNNETYVSIEIIYHDVEKYFWSTKVIATKSGPFGWDMKTLPRTPAYPLF